MNEQEYLLAWAAYAVAALGCLLVWCRMTRPVWRWLREPLRLLVAVLLFTPTVIDPARELFAPAIAVTALDLAFKVGDNSLRAMADLSMFGILAFAAYLLLALLRWPLERWWRARRGGGREPEAVDQENEPTLRELMQRGLEEAEQRPAGHDLRIEPRL